MYDTILSVESRNICGYSCVPCSCWKPVMRFLSLYSSLCSLGKSTEVLLSLLGYIFCIHWDVYASGHETLSCTYASSLWLHPLQVTAHHFFSACQGMPGYENFEFLWLLIISWPRWLLQSIASCCGHILDACSRAHLAVLCTCIDQFWYWCPIVRIDS